MNLVLEKAGSCTFTFIVYTININQMVQLFNIITINFIYPVSISNWKTALAKLDLPTNMNPYMYYVIYSCFIVILLLYL